VPQVLERPEKSEQVKYAHVMLETLDARPGSVQLLPFRVSDDDWLGAIS
jgi:hypothetical protein